jgi:hypothetical protein
LKENVAVGRLIPAGTGLLNLRNIVVGDNEEKEEDLDSMSAAVS